MEWLRDLNPFAIGMLSVAALTTVIIFFAPKSTTKTEKAASECGLKKISLNQFGHYLNKTPCSCLQSMFDGSRFNSPTIGEIYSGKYDNFIVSLFTLILPTGRAGTWQTVIHLRSDPTRWLPMFSITDDVVGKKISDILKCEHTRLTPLINPNFINRQSEVESILAALSRKSVIDPSIKSLKSPVRGIVVDSTGEDLFLYRHGELVETYNLNNFIVRAVNLWQMIDSGQIDISLFREPMNRKAKKKAHSVTSNKETADGLR
ncbi:hypothetical protein [Geomonas propionica]|uniref:DUF1571 domain-containing protein n=1 Tax=Geomonas propionica TaxID=2798582 RepID=A0ABS0YY63_9BACT|nr:hypothetical protein [Geomonas propionica]MBJ6802808.1 hypothetical protein [Geomonas propionica]